MDQAYLTDALGQIAAGLRLALILLAVMSLLAWISVRGVNSQLERYRRISWVLLSIAALAFSPAHAAWLMGHPIVNPMWNRAMDIVASAAACGCFIVGLAARGLMRNLSERRVHLGLVMNVCVVIAVVGAAWLTR